MVPRCELQYLLGNSKADSHNSLALGFMGMVMARRRKQDRSADAPSQGPLLRRADQAVVAGLVALSLAAMAAYFVVQGGFRGGLIEIDHATPLEAQFRVDINQAQWSELSQ